MKNRNYPMAIAFLAMLTFSLFSCNFNDKKPKPEDKPPVDKPNEDEEDTSKAPDGIISLDEAKILCDNYENRRSPIIKNFERKNSTSEKEFIPTQFIDFDFKTIKKYIKYVERQARKAKVKPDSLRIYLGNYGSNPRDPNRNTVFMLPTASINGDNGGFYINKKGKAELIRNYWPENEDGKLQKSEASLFPSFNTTMYQGESFILNLGHGGPPPTGDF